jgi:hypothetical protein
MTPIQTQTRTANADQTNRRRFKKNILVSQKKKGFDEILNN